MNTRREIYKYVRPERSDILKNLTIRYTQTAAFNDPFECLPCVEVPTDIEFYKAQFKERIDHEIFNRPHINTTAKRKQYMRLRQRDFALFYKTESDPRRHVNLAKHLQDAVSNVSGSLCLTESKDNILMWGPTQIHTKVS